MREIDIKNCSKPLGRALYTGGRLCLIFSGTGCEFSFTGKRLDIILSCDKNNADNGKSLLLLKDSYANAFVQFLLPYYSKITIVDPRYYSDDLEQLIKDQEITEVLILYSENNFVTDRSLYGVLES